MIELQQLMAGVVERETTVVRTATRSMRVEGLDAGFGDFTAIRQINLNIEPNHITAIIGPSASASSPNM